jgi:formylglycine-generating enzyme required for sulfatase activity
MLMSRSATLTTLSIALPALLLVGELAIAAPQLLPAFPSVAPATVAMAIAPSTVTLAPGVFDYRRSGAFLSDGNPVDGPAVTLAMSALEITTHQISAADYRLCVADGVCSPVKGLADRSDLAATGVSFDNASTYAGWLSAQTGDTWRLPTDAEWAFAAGSRYHDDALGVADADNPSVRWLAAYRVSADREPPRGPQPAGTYGINENGLVDLGGNVWEWTASCYDRTTFAADGAEASVITNCGVRVAEGAHRAYISRFIGDAKGGGCAAGVPPELLGFRLVRETHWWQHLAGILSWPAEVTLG